MTTLTTPSESSPAPPPGPGAGRPDDPARARAHGGPARADRPASPPGRWRGTAASLALALPLPVLAVALWRLGVQGAWTLPFGIQMAFVPTPEAVLRRLADIAVGGFVDDVFSGSLWAHLAASTGRVLSGFGLAAACAVPLGVVMGRFRTAFRMLDPLLTVVRPIPVTAWAPLALLVIGFGDRSTVFLVFLAAFFPILLNTVAGVRRVPERLLEAAAMLGTRPARVLTNVVLPSAMHSIVGGLRIALGLSWVILVVGETVGISVGLGSMITQARDMSKTDLIVAGMVVIGLAGFVADRLLVALVTVVTRGRPTLS